jgi:proteasome accessory factor B
MFRLSRIEGEVILGEPGSCQPPEDLDLRALAASLAPPSPHSSATVRVRAGAGDLLRRRATASQEAEEGWTEIQLPYGDVSSLADELTSFGADVVVIGPDEVRDAVVRRLVAVAGEETP